jgi:hypothetical protein
MGRKLTQEDDTSSSYQQQIKITSFFFMAQIGKPISLLDNRALFKTPTLLAKKET